MNIKHKTLIYFFDSRSKTIEKLCYNAKNVHIIKINKDDPKCDKFDIKVFPTLLFVDPANSIIEFNTDRKKICKTVKKFIIISKYIDLYPSAFKMMKRGKPYIIVPYRSNKYQNREEQLKIFTENMNTNHPEWRVLIIEQSDDNKKFARGSLLNIGYRIVEEEGGEYGIAHDVDIIPKPSVYDLYEIFPEHPIHIASLWTKYSYSIFFGGIVSMSIKDIKLVNGYANHLYGWGSDDNIIRDRIISRRLHIYKPKGVEDAFIDLDHPLTQDIPELTNESRYMDEKNDDSRLGYNTIEYKILKERTIYKNITKYTVELGNNSIEEQRRRLLNIK